MEEFTEEDVKLMWIIYGQEKKPKMAEIIEQLGKPSTTVYDAVERLNIKMTHEPFFNEICYGMGQRDLRDFMNEAARTGVILEPGYGQMRSCDGRGLGG
jgi:hypothetical protein